MQQAKAFVLRHFELFVVIVLVVATAFSVLVAVNKVAFLNFFYIPTLVAAYFLGKKQGVLVNASAETWVYHVRGNACSMLTRLPSLSKNETYWPIPGISTGSPRIFPPSAATFFIAFLMSVTAITTEGYWAGQSGFLG